MAETSAMRQATISRKTNETQVSVTVNIDGTGSLEISTGVGFFDHMLDQLSRHSLIDMEIEAKGDLHVDDHHTVEDTGIAIGQAIAKALGDRRGITRYASLDLAMDETMTSAAHRRVRPAVPGLERRLHVAQDRHLRHRTGARILPGAGAGMPASRCMSNHLRRQQPPHCRDLLQGGGTGAARSDRARSAPGRRIPSTKGTL